MPADVEKLPKTNLADSTVNCAAQFAIGPFAVFVVRV